MPDCQTNLGSWRWGFVFWLVLICLPFGTSLAGLSFGVVSPAEAQYNTQVPHEYELKAIYLYNFLNFVYWPEERCGKSEGKAREIAVIGHSPFGNALKALQDKLDKSQKQPLSIIYYGSYREGMDLSGCRLLFVCDSEKENFDKIIASVQGSPVLTVADSEQFIEAGGMITLISRQNKVRWAINRSHLPLAGLRMSAKLLDIAVEVVE
ncbi:MAG: YfiR family protein [Proteobacteria bacterium]|nr:YfiR family protein [Pseudomonadota bacterium]MBU1714238.1 YfiR family protein [Pseudomonadota bacterium]